jgi:hypothetical protein
MMGMISTGADVTGAECRGRPKTVQQVLNAAIGALPFLNSFHGTCHLLFVAIWVILGLILGFWINRHGLPSGLIVIEFGTMGAWTVLWMLFSRLARITSLFDTVDSIEYVSRDEKVAMRADHAV